MVLEEEVLAHYCGIKDVPSDSVSCNTEKAILWYEKIVEEGWQNLMDSTISSTKKWLWLIGKGLFFCYWGWRHAAMFEKLLLVNSLLNHKFLYK